MKHKFEYDPSTETLKCINMNWLHAKWTEKPPKITGTVFGAFIDLPTTSKSLPAALLKKLVGYQPHFHPKFSTAGNTFEPVLIKKLKEELDNKPRFEVPNAFAYKFNYFSSLNNDFGGIPDLIVHNPDGTAEVVDIKTTGMKNLKSNYSGYADGADSVKKQQGDYIMQIALYAYLLKEYKKVNVNKISLYVGFLTEDQYPLYKKPPGTYKYVLAEAYEPPLETETRYYGWDYTDELHQKMKALANKAERAYLDFYNTGEIKMELPNPSMGFPPFRLSENQDLLNHMKNQGWVKVKGAE